MKAAWFALIILLQLTSCNTNKSSTNDYVGTWTISSVEKNGSQKKSSFDTNSLSSVVNELAATNQLGLDKIIFTEKDFIVLYKDGGKDEAVKFQVLNDENKMYKLKIDNVEDVSFVVNGNQGTFTTKDLKFNLKR